MYKAGNLDQLVDWLLFHARRPRAQAELDTPEAHRRRAAKLTHERGGISKVAGVLVFPGASD